MTITELAKRHTPRSKAVEKYFFANARYLKDSPGECYSILVGSRTLFSRDTMDLRLQFEEVIRKLRRQLR